MIKMILLLCLVNIAHASKLNPENAHRELKASSGVSANIVEGQDLRARILGYFFTFEMKDTVAPRLDLFFKSTVSLETGSNEVLGNIAEFQPYEGINLNHAGLLYTPWDSTSFRIGALNQAELNSPLLVGPEAFAAMDGKLSVGSFYVKATRAIPSNNQLSRRLGEIDSGTPSFNLETIGFKQEGKLSFVTELSNYHFSRLSSNIAEKSNSLGNSVAGVGNATNFNYDFRGQNIMFELKYTLGKNTLLLSGQYLENNKAPKGRREGSLISVGFNKSSWTWELESFRNESDTSPAFYNSKYHGHNNMGGSAIELSYEKKEIHFSLRYTSFSPLEESAIQGATQISSFHLSKFFSL